MLFTSALVVGVVFLGLVLLSLGRIANQLCAINYSLEVIRDRIKPAPLIEELEVVREELSAIRQEAEKLAFYASTDPERERAAGEKINALISSQNPQP